MRKWILVALLCAPVSAAAVSFIGFEQLTVAASAVGFTATKFAPNGAANQPMATVASCRLETAEIRFTTDGTTPTTTVGTLLEIGDLVTVSGTDSIKRFLAIRTGASSGVLSCTYSAP